MKLRGRLTLCASVTALAAVQPAIAQTAVAEAEGDEIIVSGIRAALNEAVAIERASDTVISVITADDAGQFADQNVAESLQRIPGVTIQRVEGEGRTVQVRGLNSNFNQVVVNGAQIGSSDPDGNRSVSLDLISSDLLSGIRVAKTLTPDTDHDSLGAQVNLLTLSAFDRKGTTARVRVEGGITEYASKISPKISGDFTTLLDVGGEDTLGVAVAVSYSERNIQSEEVRGNTPLTRYVSPSGAVSATNTAGSTRFLVPSIVDQRLKNNKRERIGGTLQLDFRPDDDNQFSLTVIGARLKDQDVRTQNEWEVGQSTVTVAAAATGSARYNTTRLEQQLFFQDSTDRLFAANFYGENRFDGLTLSYGADYSKNKFTLPDALRTRFATGNNLTLGVNFDEDQADVTVISGNLAPSALAYNQTLIIDEARTDEIYSGFANLKYDFSLGGWEASLKFGGKYRDREKVIRRGELSINPTNGTNRPATIAAGLPINLAGFPTITRPSNANFPGFFSFADPAAVRDVAERTAALFNLLPTGTRRDFDFKEQTWAGYVQGQIDFSPSVSLIGGVRVEQTDYTASGLVVETIELDGNDLPPLGAGAPQSFNRKSTEYFPSLHLRADLTDQIVGRLSYSRGQVRPTFDDAKNFQEISTVRVTQGGQVVTTERELEGGNPRLEPLIADQFDATLGWYPSRSTSFTVAAFYKKLKNPFISATFSGPDVVLAGLAPLNPTTGEGFSEADTVGNGGSGKLLGVELGANHQFTGAFEGFFITGNLTLIEGEARSEFIRNNEALRLEDQAKLVGNLSAGFENEQFTGRVSATYVGNRLESVDASNPEFDIIRAGFYTVDVNLRFNLIPNVQIYADIANLTDQVDYRYYRGIDGAGLVSRTSAYGRTFQIGVIASF
jgi:iron complex outermembrane recepter protein